MSENHNLQPLLACHVNYVSGMAKAASMQPNSTAAIEFVRAEPSCEMVGLFEKQGDIEQQQPMAVASVLFDGHKNYFSLLIVNEKYRKQGLGARMTTWAIERSEKTESKPYKLWLVASKLGSPVYKRLGFKDIGYTSIYQLHYNHTGAERDSPKEKRDSTTKVASYFVEELETKRSEQFLWHQVLDMLSKATLSLSRTTRIASLLGKCTVHLLYDDSSEGKPTLLAYCAVRPFADRIRVIGPILGSSAEDVAALMKVVPSNELQLESDAKRFLALDEQGGTFFIHTDSQSGQEEQMAKDLEAMGWEKFRTNEILERDLGRAGEAADRKADSDRSVRQYAMADWSQG
ncbi:hypothetical protein CBS101457_001786 [Exobasidium rhododendri]|nr:hypothetical protein CBS101457_001786 [Exobasidium rhododendri]